MQTRPARQIIKSFIFLLISAPVISFAADAVIEPPAPVEAGSMGTWRITYRVPAEGIGKGGGVRLLIPPGFDDPQVALPQSNGYTTAATTSSDAAFDLQLDRIDIPGAYAAHPPHQTSLTLKVVEGSLTGGADVIFSYGDTADGGPGAAAAAAAGTKYTFFISVDTDGDGFYQGIDTSPFLEIIPAPASRILSVVPTDIELGKPFDVKFLITDAFGNKNSEWYGGIRLKLSNERGREVDLGRIDFPVSSRGTLTESLTIENIPEGVYRLQGTDISGKLQAETTNASFLDSEPISSTILFGEIHGHSNFSDAAVPRDPEAYLGYLVGEGLDFGGLSDHDFTPSGCAGSNLCCKDHEGAPDTCGHGCENNDISSHSGFWDECNSGSYSSEWMWMKTACDDFYPAFITLLGYEWTNRNYGHKNVYYLPPPQMNYSSLPDSILSISNSIVDPSAVPPEYATPDELWDELHQQYLDFGFKAVSIAHHPSSTTPSITDWSYHDNFYQPLVEIYSCHKSAETSEPLYLDDPNTAGLLDDTMYVACHSVNEDPPVEESYFVRGALTTPVGGKYHRFGIIAGSDSHQDRNGGDGPPYSSCSNQEPDEYYAGYGIAGVIVPTVVHPYGKRHQLFNALKKRHTYGTTGDKIILRCGISCEENGTARDYVMGDDFSTSETDPVLTANIKVAAEDIVDDKIETITIFWWNSSIGGNWSYSNIYPSGASYEGAYAIPRSRYASGLNIYYVRTYIDTDPSSTDDKIEIAWSSPIWVNIP